MGLNVFRPIDTKMNIDQLTIICIIQSYLRRIAILYVRYTHANTMPMYISNNSMHIYNYINVSYNNSLNSFHLFCYHWDLDANKGTLDIENLI